MPRNPFWSDASATLERSLEAWKNPDAASFTPSSTTAYENFGSTSGVYNSNGILDFVTVDLRADATYNFTVSGTYKQTITIFDSSGYLLNFTDGGDAGVRGDATVDSIVSFKPDYTGTYYLNVGNYYFNNGGNWNISATEDIGSDSKNTGNSAVTIAPTETLNALVTGGWMWGSNASESFIGSASADIVVTGEGNNSVYGFAGADVIVGGSGRDSLYGGADSDWLYGGAGADSINGDSGIDILFGEAGDDTIFGGSDTDYLFGGESNDLLSGDSGIDYLFGDAGNDTLNGGSETDALYGGAGADSLNGGEGDDFLQGDAGNDILTGGNGNDLFYFNGWNEGVDVITDMGAGDVLILAGYGFFSFSGVQGFSSVRAAMVQSGANVVLQTSGTSAITFLNKNVADFTANNFIV